MHIPDKRKIHQMEFNDFNQSYRIIHTGDEFVRSRPESLFCALFYGL